MVPISQPAPTSLPRLFHFSDDPGIEVFEPRAVRVPSESGRGFEWSNGPVVWTVTEERQIAYLFPRDCPRIVLWLTPETTDADCAAWWGDRTVSAIVHVEWTWMDRLRSESIYRYELPADGFEPLEEWCWVSRERVVPLGMEAIDDLPAAIAAEGAELRIMPSLLPLRDVWSTSLHASGIRLRNAQGWTA